MITDLAQSLEITLHLLLALTSKASVLAVIALLLTFGLRKWIAPSWRHLLWALVFVRLLLPDLGSWHWSALRWQGALQPVEISTPVPMFSDQTDTLPVESESIAPSTPSLPITSTNVRATATPLAPAPFKTWQILAFIWLLGMILVLAALAACWLRFQTRVLRGAVPADESWQALLAQLCLRHGWKSVPELLVSPSLSGPVLAGLWRPRIVLPAHLEPLSSDEKRHLLLHEIAHWRRADLCFLSASSMLLALHWFNPLLWLAHQRLRLEAEACADAWVLAVEDQTQARDYGSTLLKLVTSSASLISVLLTPGILGMAGSGRELRERLTEISHGMRRKRSWTVVALMVVLLAAATCFTRPLLAESKPANPDTTVQGKVVDEQGKPVPNTHVILTLDPSRVYSPKATSVTDIDGSFRFDDQTKGTKVRIMASSREDYSPGFAKTTVGDHTPITIVIQQRRSLEGLITSAVDGKPVAGARVYFSSDPNLRRDASPYGGLKWNAHDSVLSDREGHYMFPLDTSVQKRRLIRVESENHDTFLKELPALKDVKTLFNVTLPGPQNPATLKGMVFDTHGKPLSGVLVAVAEGSFAGYDSLTEAAITRRLDSYSSIFEALINAAPSDENGAFTLKAVPSVLAKDAIILAMHPSGFARVPLAEFLAKPTLQLEALNTVKARFIDPAGKPLSVVKVGLSTFGNAPNDGKSRVSNRNNGSTDPEGRFTFTQVLPRSRALFAVEDGRSSTVGEPLLLGVGETKEINITVPPLTEKSLPKGFTLATIADPEKEKTRRRVIGQFVPPPGSKDSVKYINITAHPKTYKDGFQPGYDVSDEGGRFVIPRLLPGRYSLFSHSPNFEMTSYEFSLPADPAQTDFDLGKIGLKQRQSRPSFPLPKGPTGTVKFKVQDVAGNPIEGVEITASCLTANLSRSTPPDGSTRRVLVRVASELPLRLPPVFTDAQGQATLTFERDLPNRAPIGGLSCGFSKAGFVSPKSESVGDGDTRTVTLQASPILEVKDIPANADLWVGMKPTGPYITPFSANNGTARALMPYLGRFPCLLTDQTDPNRWKISDLQVLDFQSGKTHLWQGKWTPGVVIEARVLNIKTPIGGETWAHAQVAMEKPFNPGEIRESLGETTPRMTWTTWCPVQPNGEFRIPGAPRGKLTMSVFGPGWLALDPPVNLEEHWLTEKDDVVKLELIAKDLHQRQIKVRASDGSPAIGAQIAVRSQETSTAQMVTTRSSVYRALVAPEHREAYRKWLNSAPPGQNATTDADGLATLENLITGTVRALITWTDPTTRQLVRQDWRIPVGPSTSEAFLADLGQPEKPALTPPVDGNE